MAKRFGHNPNVMGWQIDNEYSQVSYDPETRAQFQQWLKARYGTLDNLNARWTTSYWSESLHRLVSSSQYASSSQQSGIAVAICLGIWSQAV